MRTYGVLIPIFYDSARYFFSKAALILISCSEYFFAASVSTAGKMFEVNYPLLFHQTDSNTFIRYKDALATSSAHSKAICSTNSFELYYKRFIFYPLWPFCLWMAIICGVTAMKTAQKGYQLYFAPVGNMLSPCLVWKWTHVSSDDYM